MSTDLADFVDGVPGRFVPEELRGQLVEAEHLTRYWWAAGHVAGRRVLDAGCGTGYGAALLAEAGATAVTGVDVAADVVAIAAQSAPAGVTYDVGDVRSLPYDDGAFDVVTCFEVIEHVKEQEQVLAELARVLAPGGLLLLSSPNRDVYVPGNPHHVRELLPAELRRMLDRHWPHTRLLQQHNFLASTILADGGEGAELDAPVTRQLAAKAAGEEVYTLALASTAALPEHRDVVTLASALEVRQWLERFEEQQATLQRLQTQLDEAVRRDGDRRRALEQLAVTEQRAAEVVGLRTRVEELRREVERIALERTAVEQRAQRAEQTLRDVMGSPSWRITKPLRAVKRLARRR